MEIMKGYEREIECLKMHLIRRCTLSNYDQTCWNYRLANQLISDDERHRDLMRKIEEEFQRVDLVVSQANNIAYEMQKKVVYKTIVHIPVWYLKVNERVRMNLMKKDEILFVEEYGSNLCSCCGS